MRKSKLSDEDKIMIRKLHDEEGHSYPALAARYNVSSATIMRVCRPEVYAKQQAAVKEYNSLNKKEIYERRKTNTRRYTISCHQIKDAEIIQHLDNQDNMQSYIRGLIEDDIKNK